MSALHQKGGLCVCGKAYYLEAAHLFGRGNTVGEPLASHPACMRLLCRACHKSIDRYQDVELRRELQWDAVKKLRALLDLQLPCIPGDPDWEPLDVMRWIEREVDSADIYNSIVEED